jgi:MFS family permease
LVHLPWLAGCTSSAYFSIGCRCRGCHQALTDLTFYGGWFQSAHGFLSFYMSPIMGRLSDAYGRKRVWVWCGCLELIPTIIMFLAQTPILEDGPWWWLRQIFGIMSFSGGVGGAYIGDLLPKEWRAIGAKKKHVISDENRDPQAQSGSDKQKAR